MQSEKCKINKKIQISKLKLFLPPHIFPNRRDPAYQKITNKWREEQFGFWNTLEFVLKV